MHDLPAPSSPHNVFRNLVALLRPKQWIKNGFVLAPLLFSAKFGDPEALRAAFLAALLFCLGSSATYIINDIHDIENDRRHAKKSKSRPLASGAVSVRQALAVLALLYLLVAFAAFAAPAVVAVIAAYAVLNLAYTFYLKHQPVLDIFTIALGFVLRVYAGALALQVPLSSWMAITTLCLALYLAAVKRRQELIGTGEISRAVLGKYTLPLLDRYAEMSATGALVFYSLFVLTARPAMAITIPLVLFGLFRYWYVVETTTDGESPTDALLADLPLLATLFAWIGTCAVTLTLV
jgi:decaprenyl-phosphate phosphoribosyltransferase